MQNDKASGIIEQMMSKDLFSQWMQIERMEEGEGFCKLKMVVRKEMCNGFEIAHGGIIYSLADSALAFAANSHGRHAVSIETSMTHLRSSKSGDVIHAIAEERSISNLIAVYEIKVQKDNGELVALFKGTVFRKQTEWGEESAVVSRES